jgi:hypothetical protein
MYLSVFLMPLLEAASATHLQPELAERSFMLHAVFKQNDTYE